MKDKNVAIVYHSFAHYRAPIIKELLNDQEYRYLFYADAVDRANTGIKAYEIPDSSRFIYTPTFYLGHGFYCQKGLIKLALRNDINTIIYLGVAQFLNTWISASIGRIRGKRILFWTHGWPRDEGGVKEVIRGTFYRLCNGLLLYGNRARTIGIKRGFDPQRLYVVYNSLEYEVQKKYRNAVSLDEIMKVRQQFFNNAEKPVVICTCRLVKDRKLGLLLQALRLLKVEGLEVNLILVGDGPERAALSQMSKEMDILVKFYGECYDEDILARLFSASNVTVIPEKAGLTTIHSLGYGVPVITHNNFDQQGPEVEAVIPGVNGDLYDQGDCQELAAMIKKWATKPLPSTLDRDKISHVIDQYYNPEYQHQVINRAVKGLPVIN